MQHIDSCHNKVKASNGNNTVVVYTIKNKDGVPFTRIDIFTKQ